jgi:membrane-associated phospholipid phosphatase
MMSTRRFVATVVALTLIIALLAQLVILQRGYVHDVYILPQSDGRSWIEWFDWYSIRLARRLVEDKTLFEATAILGLRGVIISVCFPILGWVAWKRRTWAPIVGFVIVLLFETGLAGSMKMAMGRQFPWESWPQMGALQSGELAFPSGHATNVVALLGYMAWYFTKIGSMMRKIAWGLVSAASVIVSISSWLIRTHWPTDLAAGTAYGVIALVTVIAMFNALGLNPSATAPHSPTTRP